ncbi:unnamed protein product [Symbiodinium sp. CCMP2592]|nr:unnamed protein product [Symbiodinium sp. CCMP2592]
MADGLFGNSAAFGENSKEEQTEQPASHRRTKLYPWDSVAAQLLEPYGCSTLDSMNLKQVYEATARGNKSAAYHSHLCADQTQDAWRVGAGISLTAASLLATFEHLESKEMKLIIVEEFYVKIKAEIDHLKPHLRMLNFGKGSAAQKDTGSFRAVKKQRTLGSNIETPTPTQEQLETAAKEFFKWLSSAKTPLRSMLFLLSGSNTYYSSHCAEVVARACIQHKPITEANFVAAVFARSKQAPADTATSSDAQGLFDL